ncbi:MAG: nuclear transport factor 2 family protein [bacterium]|nr:nuclear transport factor 2 family protein [bacterium]
MVPLEAERVVDEDVRAIEELLDALELAVSQADVDRLGTLFCSGVAAVFSGTPDPVRERSGVLAVWKRHMERWTDVRICRRETVVRIHGDVAWGHFLWDGEGRSNGTCYQLKGERWTVVALWEEGRWRLAQTHTSMPYRDWEAHRQP